MDAGLVVVARLAGQTTAGGRVYPLLLPQTPTLPAISYQQVSAGHTHAMGRDATVTRVRMQVNSWAATYAEVRALARAVATQLSRFSGSAGGVQVLDILRENEMEWYDQETETRRVIQDYTIILASA